MVLIICVSLLCFTDEVQVPNADRTNIPDLELHQSYRLCFARVKLVQATPPHPTTIVFPVDRYKTVLLLQLFFICVSVVSYNYGD